jgi:hypothetical protein
VRRSSRAHHLFQQGTSCHLAVRAATGARDLLPDGGISVN